MFSCLNVIINCMNFRCYTSE